MKENNKQFFVHNGTKIIITEYFSESGKSIEDVIKEAIIRDARTSSKEKTITKN